MSSELDLYPRGLFYTADLEDTALDVGVADQEVRVKWVLLNGATVANTVTFRSSDGSVPYFVIDLEANETVRLGAFRIRPTVGSVEGGLEVVSQASLVGCRVLIAYHSTKYTP